MILACKYLASLSSIISKILPLIPTSKNMVELSISLSDRNTLSLEFINNCESLENLKLENLEFNPIFLLKLTNLKKLSLKFVKGLELDEFLYSKLKYLNIDFTKLLNFKFKNFPEIEEISLDIYTHAFN
jgi:hypothetical protein